jgi:hypothetical protein
MVKGRPPQTPLRSPPTVEMIDAAQYVGSAEHKTKGWWGGLPKAHVGADGTAKRVNKLKTTICDLVTAGDRKKAMAWVKDALKSGKFKYHEGDKEFPSRIGYFDEESGKYWMGFAVNQTLGTYKGWPVEAAEFHENFD